MPDTAGEILKGNLSVVAPGHEAEAGPGGLDAASTRRVEAARSERSVADDDDLEIGGAPNRSKDDVASMMKGIDAGLRRETPAIQQVSQRDEGMER